MKKIRDILPGGSNSDEKISSSNKSSKKMKLTNSKMKKTLWAIGIIVFLGLGVVLALNFWAYAELTVTIKENQFTANPEIVISSSQATLDLEQKVLPGEFFEASGDKWLTFESTGKGEAKDKAHGAITVYNSYNPPSALTLKENTRFLSSDGEKIFRAVDKISLPAAKLEGGKVVASATQVEVVAYEAGEDYNIAPSQFSVPGLAGTAWYSYITGESTQAMAGGTNAEVKTASQDDIDSATEELKSAIREVVIEKLKTEQGQDFYFSQQNIFSEEFDISCFADAGDVVDDFKCEGEGSLKVLAPKRSDLEIIARSAISFQAPEEVIKEGSLAVDFTLQDISLENETLSGAADVSAVVYAPLDETFFSSDIAGKTEQEVNDIVAQNYPQATISSIAFWPFWVSKVPQELNKIRLTVDFSD